MKKILTFIFVVLSGIIPYGNTATVNAADLATLISNALSGKVYGDTVTVTLDAGTAYELESVAAAGLVNLIINGNGATVTLGKNGQLTAKVNLTINDVNFNCANAAASVILLPTMTEKADSVLYNKYGANGKNAFFMDAMTFNNVNASELKVPFIMTAKNDGWAIKYVTFNNCIFQLNNNKYTAFIDMQKNGGNTQIRFMNVENSTFYNIQSETSSYFAKFSANIAPEKLYGKGSDAGWTMTSNTFVQMAGNKFTDRYIENKMDTITWTKNVFYSVGKITMVRNCKNEFTAADNATDGLYTSDNKNYATIDNTCISIPTGAFDFDASKLLDAFCLYKNSYAYKNSMGDPRWLTKSKEFKKTVSTRKLATMCWPYAVKIPTNVKAYIATQNEGENAVTLVKLTEGQIPANTGVVIYSDITDATNYEFEPTKYSGTQELTGNCLKGVVKETLYSDVEVTGKTNYALMPPATDDGSSLEFRPVTSGSYAANTAYLQLSSSASKISFNFDDDATGIEGLESLSSNSTNENMYNLQGVRVNENYKGIVIVNGKKHLKQ